MTTTPSWQTMRTRWPNANASRFIDAGSLRWHVQILGAGPAVLLLHGSGAASHSWRDVAPQLARHFTVVAPDLPGHGFTSRPTADRMSILGMRDELTALLDVLGIQPVGLAGHSAGGALALALADTLSPRRIIGINAALVPPHAMMSIAAPLIQNLVRSDLIAFLTIKLAESDRAFSSLMRSTGSTVSAEQFALYRVFAQSRAHASAIMSMFANWDLDSLVKTFPRIETPVTLIVGENDGWVPPADTRRVAVTLPHVHTVVIPNAGHLAHEERPDLVSEIIERELA